MEDFDRLKEQKNCIEESTLGKLYSEHKRYKEALEQLEELIFMNRLIPGSIRSEMQDIIIEQAGIIPKWKQEKP